MSSIITEWSQQNKDDYGKRPLTALHSLHQGDKYSDENLAKLLEEYPRNKLGVYTMGQDHENWKTFVPGDAGDLSGEEIIEAVKKGRIWLNLRAVNDDIDDYTQLCEQMFQEVDSYTGCSTYKQDLGVLISSPNAQVFYHLDIPLVLLWQLRGTKKVWIYPNSSDFAPDENIEGIVLKETEEEFEYNPDFDRHALEIELEPGMFASWPQFAPHRIENHDMLNVSLSVEYVTMQAILQANMMYTNGVLRRRFGSTPLRENSSLVSLWVKAAFARALKLTRSGQQYQNKFRSHFKIDLSEKDCVRFYDKPQ